MQLGSADSKVHELIDDCTTVETEMILIRSSQSIFVGTDLSAIFSFSLSVFVGLWNLFFKTVTHRQTKLHYLYSEETSKSIGCSLYIQQPAAANLYRKSHKFMLNAAAFRLQQAAKCMFLIGTDIGNKEKIRGVQVQWSPYKWPPSPEATPLIMPQFQRTTHV